MPEGEQLTQSNNALEQEIAQIEQDLASKRAALEEQKQSGEVTEIPNEKETLKELTKGLVPPPVALPEEKPQEVHEQPVAEPAPIVESPSYLSPENKVKVQELVNTAFNSTISEAIKQAQATNSPALVDAFHDALADELYQHLVERGKLNKL